ncbi:uncharacterized protein LOC133899777 [Phragmites australis]|uniref:uncharacterized protein LOC133899777 n=1 Tax=Phragmites australis TaxID=29695 RepID=UPI002D79D0D9|nr:uncharacterized protein LOC133899777 [Phragmites australis]
MYNPEQQQPPQRLMGPPRISFSTDFALEPPPPRPPSGAQARTAGDADFEFSSVGSRPMMAADQLFSKGRILPLREAAGGSDGRPLTLRDELRAHEGNGDRGRRAPRWKELLGLKRAHKKSAERAGGTASADAHVDLGDHVEAGE